MNILNGVVSGISDRFGIQIVQRIFYALLTVIPLSVPPSLSWRGRRLHFQSRRLMNSHWSSWYRFSSVFIFFNFLRFRFDTSMALYWYCLISGPIVYSSDIQHTSRLFKVHVFLLSIEILPIHYFFHLGFLISFLHLPFIRFPKHISLFNHPTILSLLLIHQTVESLFI